MTQAPFVYQPKPFVGGNFLHPLPSLVATLFYGSLFQDWEKLLAETHAAAPETPPFRSEVPNAKT